MSMMPCWKINMNSSESLRQLMGWKLPFKPSGKSYHKNTSKRRRWTSTSAWLPAWLWQPMVVTLSICSNSVHLQVCILISSLTSRLCSEPPTDYWWTQHTGRWEMAGDCLKQLVLSFSDIFQPNLVIMYI